MFLKAFKKTGVVCEAVYHIGFRVVKEKILLKKKAARKKLLEKKAAKKNGGCRPRTPARNASVT